MDTPPRAYATKGYGFSTRDQSVQGFMPFHCSSALAHCHTLPPPPVSCCLSRLPRLPGSLACLRSTVGALSPGSLSPSERARVLFDWTLDSVRGGPQILRRGGFTLARGGGGRGAGGTGGDGGGGGGMDSGCGNGGGERAVDGGGGGSGDDPAR